MKVLICGGRDYTDWETFQEKMNMLGLEITEIAHGDARGADSLADDYAWLHGIPCTKFPAEWKKHGNSAGPIRNVLMLKEFQPDVVVAFPGGRGTGDMINRAMKAGVNIIRVY
jgi:hypothetical protein